MGLAQEQNSSSSTGWITMKSLNLKKETISIISKRDTKVTCEPFCSCKFRFEKCSICNVVVVVVVVVYQCSISNVVVVVFGVVDISTFKLNN